MSRKLFIGLAFLCVIVPSFAEDVFNYHKASIYSIMLKHENQEYCDEMVEVFKKIPVQDNFYDFSLTNLIFKAGQLEESDTTRSDNQKSHIDRLLYENAIGRRLVAKWFNRDKNGTFNTNNIYEKGYYNVSAADIQNALLSIRSSQDEVILNVGEELIGNTYILVNDIRYGDKRSSREKKMSTVIGIGTALSAIPLVGYFAGMGTIALGGHLANDYSGFNVTVTSYLYRLDWNENISNAFLSAYYTDYPDAAKKSAFNKEKDLFTLTYIGNQTVHSSNSNFKGVNDREAQIRLVCTRAIDKAIAQLQKEHPEFRVRTPLLSTSPIRAHIGIREDVTPDSRFEVLEVSENAQGVPSYKRVAVIKPKKDRIWDNRYMAEYEEHKNGMLNATEFELVSGNISQTACLIREIDN